MLVWTTDRNRYAMANAAMIALLVVVWFVTSALHLDFTAYNPLNPLYIFAFLWNIVSFRRIAETRLWLLHAAPWVTIAGFYAFFWGVAVSEGQYETGLSWQQAIVPYSGIVGLLAWPAATGVLSSIDGRQT